MSGINPVSDSSYGNNNNQSRTPNDSLNFDDFLNLLTNELKYQDPSNPVSNTEYVSQMAQLSSLSQLNNIYSAISTSAAFNMIGKEVTYYDTDSSGQAAKHTGVVDSVLVDNGTIYLNIDGTAVPLGVVVEVGTPDGSKDDSAT